MVNLKKKHINGKTYYYLEHSYRKNGTVHKKERYLGTTTPHNIGHLTQQFLNDLYQETWYTSLDTIQQQYTKEQRTIPPGLQKKRAEQFSIRFTYSTNKIEGSTLTLRETALLLEDGITPSQRPVDDVKETEAHKKLFTDMLAATAPVSLATILHWHKEIFKHTKPDIAGRLRDHSVEISGSTYIPPYAIELQSLLIEFFDWYKKNRKKIHPVHLAALAHLRLVSIHPFVDGNGRISRLFMNHVLYTNGYPMLVIEYRQRTSYYHALERSQLAKDEGIFTVWFFKRYLKEYRKYLK